MSFHRVIAATVVLCLVFAAGLPSLAQEQAIEAAGEAVVEDVHEGAHSESPNPMAFGPDLAVFTGIVFLLLVGILGKYAWPAIAAGLDERERKIADNIAAAAAQNEAAKKLLAEHDSKLAATAGEIRALLDEARRDAEHTKRRIEEDGRKAAAEELARAVREIERAKDGAIQDLATTSANVAIDLTRKVVREELSAERQSQIVRDALSMMSAMNPSKN